jgi:hypothetical protein
MSRQTKTFDRTGDKTAELQLLTSGKINWLDEADDVMKTFSPKAYIINACIQLNIGTQANKKPHLQEMWLFVIAG